MSNDDNVTIPVSSILLGSIRIAVADWRRVSTALVLPTLLLVVIWAMRWTVFEGATGFETWIIWLAYKIAFVVFAVTCHRLVLVEGAPPGFGVSFGMREIRFVGWAALVYVMIAGIVFVPMNVVMNLPFVPNAVSARVVADYAPLIFAVPATYVLARVCLVFPATAVDRNYGMRWSWARTRGNSWRIFVVVGLYPFFMSTLLWLVSRENATLVEQVVVALAYYAGLAFEVFALSLTYKEIVSVDRQRCLSA